MGDEKTLINFTHVKTEKEGTGDRKKFISLKFFSCQMEKPRL